MARDKGRATNSPTRYRQVWGERGLLSAQRKCFHKMDDMDEKGSSTHPTKEGESGGFEEESIAHAADCLRTCGGFTVLSSFNSLMKC